MSRGVAEFLYIIQMQIKLAQYCPDNLIMLPAHNLTIFTYTTYTYTSNIASKYLQIKNHKSSRNF